MLYHFLLNSIKHPIIFVKSIPIEKSCNPHYLRKIMMRSSHADEYRSEQIALANEEIATKHGMVGFGTEWVCFAIQLLDPKQRRNIGRSTKTHVPVVKGPENHWWNSFPGELRLDFYLARCKELCCMDHMGFEIHARSWSCREP